MCLNDKITLINNFNSKNEFNCFRGERKMNFGKSDYRSNVTNSDVRTKVIIDCKVYYPENCKDKFNFSKGFSLSGIGGDVPRKFISDLSMRPDILLKLFGILSFVLGPNLNVLAFHFYGIRLLVSPF